MGYGLLTLPAMPERKKLGRLFKGFYPDISTHEMSTIAYRYAESGLSSWHVSSKIFLTYCVFLFSEITQRRCDVNWQPDRMATVQCTVQFQGVQNT